MPSFKIINKISEINLDDKWVQATKFNSKDRIVDEKGNSSDYKGRQYRIIEKRERTFSNLERFGRGFLGSLALVCTSGLALCSKSVRNLFTKSKENIRFAIIEPSVPSNNQPSNSSLNQNISDKSPKEKINQPTEQTENITATKIQSLFGGHLDQSAFKNLKNEREEALKVQEERRKAELENEARKREEENLKTKESLSSFVPSNQEHVAHLALKKLQTEKLEEQRSRAAIKIQSILRGYSARVQAETAKKSLLSYALLETAKPYIDVPSNLKGIPRASSGKTLVYLPKELPIVLKQSGSPQNQKRFDQMKQGRDICEKNSYKHLVIPKARVYGNFIIESRLPITVHDTKEQIGLYIENRERFAGAVKEFTGFLCQSEFDDITGGSNDPYGTLSKTPIGRYDNIALYLEEDQGKIGLIDLEQFRPKCIKWPKELYFSKCRIAVHLFPYHLNEIMSAAKEFADIEVYRKNLEKERAGALKRFKLAYEDHLEFIKEKGISLEKPFEIVKVSSLRKENIKEAMISIIRKEHDGVSYENCLGEKPNEVIKLFEKSFPKILDLTTAFLSEILKERIESTKEVISSYRQLLSCRTLRFSSSSRVYKVLKEKVASELQMMKIEREWELEENGFSSLIIQGIFKELAKGRELAYYNPNFGYGDYATQCIFC